jgi:zinc protease
MMKVRFRFPERVDQMWPVRVIFLVLLLLGRTSYAQQPDRSKPPEIGPPPSLDLPPIQHFKLANGVPVIVVEKHRVPLVQMELLVRTGSVNDPPGKIGLASLTAAMMDEGAGTRSSLELADAIDFLGASIGTYAGQHTSGITMHTPRSKLDSALVLFTDIALRPTFPADELERQRISRLTSLAQWHDEPRTVASVLVSRVLYGRNHPYGVPQIGTEKSIRAFTPADLKQFHATFYQPSAATLIVVGDVSPDTLLPKLEAAFGSWKGTSPAPSAVASPEQIAKRVIYLVDKPGAAQSELRVARIGAERLTEDYFPLIVMNTVLGGSFASRLNQNLREEHGYAYGAGSGFAFRPKPGPFVASAAVQTDVTDKALAEMMKELTNIRTSVTDEEIHRARNYLALQYPSNFASVADISSQLAELAVYGLPDDYLELYIGRVLAVTKEDVERVARKYIDPDRVVIVVVGDRKKIEPGIEALKLGDLKTMTIRDVLGKPPVVAKSR